MLGRFLQSERVIQLKSCIFMDPLFVCFALKSGSEIFSDLPVRR